MKLINITALTLTVVAVVAVAVQSGSFSGDKAALAETNDTHLDPSQVISDDKTVAEGKGEACSGKSHHQIRALSLYDRFRNTVYRFAKFVAVEIPKKISEYSGYIYEMLGLPTICGFILATISVEIDRMGEAIGFGVFTVVSLPLMLLSVPFAISGWVFKLISKITSGIFTTYEQISNFMSMLNEELEPIYRTGDDMKILEAIGVVSRGLMEGIVPAVRRTAIRWSTKNEAQFPISAKVMEQTLGKLGLDDDDKENVKLMIDAKKLVATAIEQEYRITKL